jgi:hypothetical protein
VPAGEIASDPRLREIDLRGRLHAFTFELVPPSGSVEPSGRLVLVPAGRSGPVQGRSFRGRTVVVVTPHARIDATVLASGFRAERVDDPGPLTEVRLSPGLSVVLALPPELEPLPRGLSLAVVLAGVESSGGGLLVFDGRREVRWSAARPGRVHARWALQRRSDGGGVHVELPLEHEFEVRDVEGEQRIELPLSNADLAAALPR